MEEHFPFYIKGLAREAEEPSKEQLQKLLDLLNEEKLQEEIKEGKVTLATIRPNVGPEANVIESSDSDIALIIEDLIKDLGVMTKFSLTLTPEVFDRLYDEHREKQLQMPPYGTNPKHSNRREEFSDIMTSGTATFFLLYDEAGEAIKKWREQMGYWDIDRYRGPNKIRGKIGRGTYNNLIHGSESPENVMRELGIIKDLIKQKIEAIQNV